MQLSTEMNATRILLVDDQLLFVQSLKKVLDTDADDIKVVGIALSGEEALRLVGQHRPDLVLMDVRMPNIDGVEATRLIHEQYPETAVVMLTTFEDDEFVYDALNHGAIGYLLKDMPPEQLITSIRAARAGTVLISPAIARKLLTKGLSHSQNTTHVRPAWLDKMNRKEIEILKLVAIGCDNQEISERIFLAPQTVKNYISSIYAKLGTSNRAHAISIALSAHLDE
jgi:DNA-binding NarL/FixJ family response regulator